MFGGTLHRLLFPGLHFVSSGLRLLQGVRNCGAHPRRHGLRQGISYRTVFSRGDDSADCAGEFADDSLFYCGEGVGAAEVLLNGFNVKGFSPQISADFP